MSYLRSRPTFECMPAIACGERVLERADMEIPTRGRPSWWPQTWSEVLSRSWELERVTASLSAQTGQSITKGPLNSALTMRLNTSRRVPMREVGHRPGQTSAGVIGREFPVSIGVDVAEPSPMWCSPMRPLVSSIR